MWPAGLAGSSVTITRKLKTDLPFDPAILCGSTLRSESGIPQGRSHAQAAAAAATAARSWTTQAAAKGWTEEQRVASPAVKPAQKKEVRPDAATWGTWEGAKPVPERPGRLEST